MAVLKDRDREKLAGLFREISNEVNLLMFTQENECQYCKATREMLEEVSALSDHIELEVCDLLKDAGRAKALGVDKLPATMVLGEKDYGIRFYGIPAGYEFTVLVQDILDVGKRSHSLGKEAAGIIASIDKPVHLQVLISPT